MSEGLIKSAVPAYTFYQRANTIKIKEQLIQSGQPADFGSVATAVSLSWRGMDSKGREKYEELARVDRLRFENESLARDQEIERARDEKRENMQSLVNDGERRGNMIARQEEHDALMAKREENAAARKPKVLSEEEKAAKAAIKKEKNEKDAEIKRNLEALKIEKGKQAKKR